MNSKEMLVIASGIAAGSISEGELADMNLGDDALTQILELTTSFGAGSIASSMAANLLNTKFGNDICDTADEYVVEPVKEVLNDVGDVLDELNPFSGW